MESGVDTVFFASGVIGIVVATIGGVLASVGGVMATLAARKLLITARGISSRIEAVERRLLVTQVRIITEGVMSEASHVEHISSALKKMMIEGAIVDGTSTSSNLTTMIESIDKRLGGVTMIRREAQQRRESVVGLNSLSSDKLGVILTRTESHLVKLRRIKKLVEKNLADYKNGDQSIGDAAY